MSFTRANPSGWSSGAKLTSAQANAIDINVSKALDKSAAGDTLSGVVFLAPSGQIVAAGPSGSGGTILVGAQGLQGYEPASIQAIVGGAISLATAGDFVAFGVTRTRIINSWIIPQYIDGSSWHPNQGFISGQASTASIYLALPDMHDGATLTSVSVAVNVGTHSGGLPAIMPSFDIRRGSTTNPSSTNVSLISTGPVFASAASGTAWHNGGNPQNWSGTIDQNNVIDKSQFYYYLVLTDESGSLAVPGNAYLGLSATYGNITSMYFH